MIRAEMEITHMDPPIKYPIQSANVPSIGLNLIFFSLHILCNLTIEIIPHIDTIDINVIMLFSFIL